MNDDPYLVPARTEYRYLVQEDEGEELQYVRHRNYVNPLLVVSRRCICLITSIVVALLSIAAYLAYIAQTPPPGVANVLTGCGEFRGRHMDGTYSFKGMPYAAPPVGDLRWAPPAEPKCRKGIMDASRFGSVCAQIQPLVSTGQVMGQEDCLFINVWTPTLQPDAKLPVIVFFHGGSLQMSSGGEDGYRPTEKLAADTGVVYVSFNYRLNAFGFMALEILREGSPTNTSGNYGFMDQIAALKWVQRNIHAFGGDPKKVTILGHSSGGTSVWTMMTSPLGKGLFRAGVDMSGSYVYTATLQQVEKDNLWFLKKTGCRDLACLRRLSITQILQAIPWKEYPYWAQDDLFDLPTKGLLVGSLPVVDGYVLQAPPLEVWEKKLDYSDVPFVVGSTAQETDFSPPADNITMWTWEDYRWHVTEKLKTFNESLPKRALALYPPSDPCPTKDRCPERALTTMGSDIRVTCPLNHLAWRAAVALDSPVYRYVVTHTPSNPANTSWNFFPFPSIFSYHGLDTVAFLGWIEPFLGKTPSDGDKMFAALITQHFINFARTGKMTDDWPEYTEAIALLSDKLSLVPNYRADRCQLWKDNGMFAYAWVG
ncbi:para-nitrobenzyl esterase-like [Antennarius striatus]|uniref:para-nitrobenzyl esterase-like n=1 Tax=Antennarius striatus TaxID=241820 RepID=UPI0035B09A08